MSIYVSFTNSNETEIGSVFSSVQSHKDFIYFGIVDENDVRYLEFVGKFQFNRH